MLAFTFIPALLMPIESAWQGVEALVVYISLAHFLLCTCLLWNFEIHGRLSAATANYVSFIFFVKYIFQSLLVTFYALAQWQTFSYLMKGSSVVKKLEIYYWRLSPIKNLNFCYCWHMLTKATAQQLWDGIDLLASTDCVQYITYYLLKFVDSKCSKQIFFTCADYIWLDLW